MKYLAFSGIVVILTTAITGCTQKQISQKSQNFNVVQTQNFSCGPNLRTYIVKSLTKHQATGIRCVKYSNGNPNKPEIPVFSWYGEGNWNGHNYRHLGQVLYKGYNLVGYASDMQGNGEKFNNNFLEGDIKVEIVNLSKIRLTGAWNEEWQLVQATNYKPLPKPKTCGQNFDQYRVSALTGNPQGDGLRCFLRAGQKNTTWFGNGNWTGSTYSHLGTRSLNGYSTADICNADFGMSCNESEVGKLKFRPISGGFEVTGDWAEKWNF